MNTIKAVSKVEGGKQWLRGLQQDGHIAIFTDDSKPMMNRTYISPAAAALEKLIKYNDNTIFGSFAELAYACNCTTKKLEDAVCELIDLDQIIQMTSYPSESTDLQFFIFDNKKEPVILMSEAERSFLSDPH